MFGTGLYGRWSHQSRQLPPNPKPVRKNVARASPTTSGDANRMPTEFKADPDRGGVAVGHGLAEAFQCRQSGRIPLVRVQERRHPPGQGHQGMGRLSRGSEGREAGSACQLSMCCSNTTQMGSPAFVREVPIRAMCRHSTGHAADQGRPGHLHLLQGAGDLPDARLPCQCRPLSGGAPHSDLHGGELLRRSQTRPPAGSLNLFACLPQHSVLTEINEVRASVPVRFRPATLCAIATATSKMPQAPFQIGNHSPSPNHS